MSEVKELRWTIVYISSRMSKMLGARELGQSIELAIQAEVT